MKINKLSTLLIVLITSTLTLSYGQEVDAMGKKAGEVPKIQLKEYFQAGRYVAFSTPDGLKNPKYKGFNKKQHSSSRSLIQAYVAASNKDWIAKLKEHGSVSSSVEKQLPYRRSKDFHEEYLFEILVEFSFALENHVYNGLVVKHNVDYGKVKVLPYISVLTDDGWKISEENKMAEFSGFLMLKPEYFKEYLEGNAMWISNSLLFKDIYVAHTFSLDVGFTIKALLSAYTKSEICKYLLSGNKKEIKEYINIKFTEPIQAGISYSWSDSPFDFFIYHKDKPYSFTAGWTKPTYSRSPEWALATWMFERDSLIKKQHVTYPEDLDIDLKDGYHLNCRMGDVYFEQKYIIRKDSNLYALLYFENWESRNENKKATTGTSFSRGTYRFLLSYKSGEWKIETHPDNTLAKFVYIIDQINEEAQLTAFGKEKKNQEIVKYVNYIGLLPEEGTNYIDINQAYNWGRLKLSRPKSAQRKSLVKNGMPKVFPIPQN